MRHIAVTVALLKREDWPVRRSPAPGMKAQIEIKTPHLPFIQRELRALQGLLSLYGLRSIDTENPEIQWMPESAEEKEDLPLFSYQKHSEPLTDEALRPLTFDLMARAVIASDAATDIEVPLNFFRRGMNDIYDRNYIEAIYDFYFVLETQFGEGQFKQNKVLKAFQKSDQLYTCIQRALCDPGPMINGDQSVLEKAPPVGSGRLNLLISCGESS